MAFGEGLEYERNLIKSIRDAMDDVIVKTGITPTRIVLGPDSALANYDGLWGMDVEVYEDCPPQTFYLFTD